MGTETRSFVYVKRIFLVIAALFLLRLAFLQVFVHGEYTANATEVRTIQYTTAPHRGTIYDRNGTVLAVSVDATTVYANPTEVTNVQYEARKLADVLGGEESEYAELLRTPDTPFVYVKRQADVDVAERVKQLQLDGIYFLEESRREYPNASIGGNVIGACDVDGNGICGLELQYDEVLRGTPGEYSAERGINGAPIPGGVHLDVPAVDGEDIVISIDLTLQNALERALEKGLEKYDEPRHGSAVVMDAETGEIHAMASFPYLNPADLTDSMVGSDNLTPVTQAFEPGSVFKAFSALAVLQENALSPDDELFVPAELEADEYTITDAHEREDEVMTFSTILDNSSNVGISLAIDKVGFGKLSNVLTALKFSEKTGIDFPGEDSGSLTEVSQWSKIGGYNISFGQGLTATPLQVVRAYGALANDGVMVQPHFLLTKPQTGETPEYASEQVLTDQDAIDTLNTMLRGVVTNGTGKDAYIEGYEVVGKTSTAEIAENGTYAEDRYNLCFSGFIANSSSKLVCNVTANDVHYDRNVAGIFRDIMAEAIELYKIVPE